MRIGFIGGTGLYRLLEDAETVHIETPYGTVPVQTGRLGGGGPDAVFLNRHGTSHRVPPHRIDHRRNIDALARTGAEAVFAVHNTGSLQPGIAPGHLVTPHDFVDLTGRSDGTFFDEHVVHVDLSEPYCPVLRSRLADASDHVGWPSEAFHDEGVYVAMRGPRLETPAEVNFLATLGDVVGMTGCPEAALARERGLCYASLSFVANAAAGLGAPLAAEDLRQALAAEAPRIGQILLEAAARTPQRRGCGCRAAAEGGRLAQLAAG